MIIESLTQLSNIFVFRDFMNSVSSVNGSLGNQVGSRVCLALCLNKTLIGKRLALECKATRDDDDTQAQTALPRTTLSAGW